MSGDDLQRMLKANRALGENAEAFYAMLQRLGQVKSHRVFVYRCATDRRCLLADVLNTTSGILIHQPGYKLSAEVNSANSTESGRAKNTTDGARHWKDRTFMLSQALNLTLSCDHIPQQALDLDGLHRDLGSDTRERLIGSD